MKKPYLLSDSWFSTKKNHLFSNPEDILKARLDFLEHRPATLNYLLEKRYSWMNAFITEEERGVEIGCGTGLSKLFIKSKNFLITDFINNSWIDRHVDALQMPFEDGALDYIVVSNVVHHLAKPSIFMNECARVLNYKGRLIVQETNLSLLLRFLLRVKNHEGYSYGVDVFDSKVTCNSPDDPWSCNVAIPNLLFDQVEKLENAFPFKYVHKRYTECLLWPLSGGIAPVGKQINFPRRLLEIIDKIDSLLIAFSKNIFALQMQVVLEKIK